ncbi:hypothetical protein G5714_004408 [Onychostoma macrolepis]|uniref:non-specific serine/threonine protein kinase n=1 Tax=Onychostoma macrolepis TaxID=369639 RepID=A0A7J6D544_9TELE|nr:hypothetical protein G5714_004408 [Onychostoma macrolepis]
MRARRSLDSAVGQHLKTSSPLARRSSWRSAWDGETTETASQPPKGPRLTQTQLILIRARPAPNQRLSRIKQILSHPQPQVHPASVRQTVTQIQLILSQLKPGPSGPVPAALQDPTDLQLDPSIRTVSFPGPSTLALNLLLNRAPLSPCIVHMLDWFEEEDRFILVLEYSQPSKDLFKFVFKEMPSESQARDLMYQAVLGAKHCLVRGVLHRDIKLDNYVINTATKQTGRDEWHWSSGEPALYLNWEPGQPDGRDECAVMLNGEWYDLPCSDTRHFICTNKEIQRRVMNVVKRASTAAVWLGLHNYCIMNMWIWLSGEIVCYQNWAPGNGTTPENCKLEKRKGAVQSGGDQRWISLPESHKLNFICSRY